MSTPLEKQPNFEQNDSDGEEQDSELFYLASDEYCEFALPRFESEDDVFYSAVESFSEEEKWEHSGGALFGNIVLVNDSESSDSLEPLKSFTGEPSERHRAGEGEEEKESVLSIVENINSEIPLATESIFNNLEMINEIGKGTYGSVFLVRNKREGTLIVDKICDSRFADDAIKAYKIMKLAETNRFFLNTMGHSTEPGGQNHHLFMEYFPSTNLHQYLDRNILVFSEVQTILRQITQAVAFLHYHNIMHRDLKPSNILIDEKMNCKLIDFGLSEISPKARGYLGTENFCAPEVTAHRGEGATLAPSYGLEIDSYSLGITALYMGANLCPTKFLKDIFVSQMDICDPEILKVLKKLNTDGPDESFHDLIYNLIAEEPSERLSTKAVLSHNFFKKTFTRNRINLTPETIEKLKKKKKSIFRFWKKPKNTKSEENFENRFVKTLIANSHLMPLPLNVAPRYWEYDHAFWLYPLPDVVVCADKNDPYTISSTDCIFFNPVYISADKLVEDSQIPDDITY